ncbi:uncharacterized protein LOC135384384 [Ornithodoros turicata]|uniref:uncharacterized protein LOC135384384 n=1 Tax=Ornithodoros turicata TaxID=34597 RepID=UPI003139F0F7
MRYFPEVMAGFPQGRSSIDSVIDIVSSAQQARSEGQLTAAVFLDVMKAYDSVFHSAVVATVQESGAGARAVSWLQDFLSDRTLFVHTADGDTAPFPVSRGVPQGSVLSPLLFNLVIASLPAHLPANVKITIYADDVCIWTSGTRRDAIQRRLQQALDVIEIYIADRGLRVSTSKTVAMTFTNRSFKNYALYVAGTPLDFVPRYKYLGAIVDKRLSWFQHIKALSTKTKKFVNLLRRISGAWWDPSCSDLRHVHNALVLGLLRYHLPALHGISRTGERDLLNAQARGLRVCLGLPRTAETYTVLAEAQETSVHILRDRETLRIIARFLTQHPCHYLLSIEDARPASAFGGAVSRLKAILPDRLSGVSYAPPLWALAKPQVLTSVPGLGRKRETPLAVARQLVLEYLSAHHQQRQAIYTDGSVTLDGATAAIYVPQGNIEQVYRLSHTTSSTEAELFAIHAALRHITTSPPGTWTILSDSKAALETLDSHCTKTTDDLHTMAMSLANTALASAQYTHNICLQCIPRHIGLGENDRADAAARRAHEQPDAAARIPLTPSACRIQIRRWAAQEARCFIRESARFNDFLRSIDPAVEFSPPRRLQRPQETLLHRLRLNLAYTPPVQRMMGRQISALCDVCEVVADTSHLLLTCPKCTNHRATLFRYLERFGHNQLTLAALLGPVPQHQQWAVTTPVLHFLKCTGLASKL